MSSPTVRRARWQTAAPAAPAVAALAAGLGVSDLLARLLVNRGLTDPAAAHTFLHGTLADAHDPSLLLGMAEAVRILDEALQAGRHIRVWGDYDVDGVTGTALLVRALQALGGTVSWYLPHRVHDGYGLNKAAIKRAADDGVQLLLTVDCGIGAVEEVQLAQRLGMGVLITDHHLPPDVLPAAEAVVNPNQPACHYPCPHLCGAGVAYKLLDALCRRRGLSPRAPERFLDLVTLATVSDVVPLLGENRLLVKAGLPALAATRKLGLQALMKDAGIEPAQLEVRHLAYVLGPRLNAAGRLAHAEQALRLLLTADSEEAARLAAELSTHNRARQDQEKRTLEEAVAQVEGQCDLAREWALVLGSDQWHPGVIGIVASRLVERYHRPTLLAAVHGGVGKGSGRSIPGFHLYEALCECGDLLERFGGHAAAAGFTVSPERLPDLRQRLCEVAASRLTAEDLAPVVQVEAWLTGDDLTPQLALETARLEPYGMGNPAPVLGLRQAELLEARRVGDGSHLKLRLRAAGREQAGIWFGFGYLADLLAPPELVDVVFEPALSEWNGSTRLDLQVVDMAVGRELPAKAG